MATYNGEKYIENQILSLFQQTYKNWTLYIHDDGSTDNTVQIIKKYAEIDNRIIFIEDTINALKAGKNFLHTLSYSQADYAIFCDQDDIWLENKIEELLKVMVEKDQFEHPVLVYSDGYAWNEEGCILPESISTHHAKALEDFIIFNGGYQGCSIMMNRKLIDLAIGYDGYIYHHDDVVSLLAHSFGQVYFLPKQLMLYRQHKGAVTGEKVFIKQKFGGLLNNVGYLISYEHYKFKESFYSIFKNELSGYNKKIFEFYFGLVEKNNRIFRAFYFLLTPLTFGGKRFKLFSKVLLQRLFDK